MKRDFYFLTKRCETRCYLIARSCSVHGNENCTALIRLYQFLWRVGDALAAVSKCRLSGEGIN